MGTLATSSSIPMLRALNRPIRICAALLVLGGCLLVSAQSSKPNPITRETMEQRLGALERDRAKVIANINAYDGAIQEIKYWIQLLKSIEKKEAMNVFPKWKYRGEEGKLVKSAEEEIKLGLEWSDAPSVVVKKRKEQ